MSVLIEESFGMSHLDAIHPQDVSQQDHATLRVISGRVRWLATAIIDQANRGRPNPTGVKVGGHQASSASMVEIMVALWFHELTATDRVSVKPHASPTLHAINYLLGDLHASYLPTLRQGRAPVLPQSP